LKYLFVNALFFEKSQRAEVFSTPKRIALHRVNPLTPSLPCHPAPFSGRFRHFRVNDDGIP